MTASSSFSKSASTSQLPSATPSSSYSARPTPSATRTPQRTATYGTSPFVTDTSSPSASRIQPTRSVTVSSSPALLSRSGTASVSETNSIRVSRSGTASAAGTLSTQVSRSPSSSPSVTGSETISPSTSGSCSVSPEFSDSHSSSASSVFSRSASPSSRVSGPYPTPSTTATHTFSYSGSQSRGYTASPSPAAPAVAVSVKLPWCGPTLLVDSSGVASALVKDLSYSLDVPETSVALISAVCLRPNDNGVALTVGTVMTATLMFSNVSESLSAASSLFRDFSGSGDAAMSSALSSVPAWLLLGGVGRRLDNVSSAVGQLTAIYVGKEVGEAFGCSANLSTATTGMPRFTSAFALAAAENGIIGASSFICRVGTVTATFLPGKVAPPPTSTAPRFNSGEIAGIVIGSLAGVVIIYAALLLLSRTIAAARNLASTPIIAPPISATSREATASARNNSKYAAGRTAPLSSYSLNQNDTSSSELSPSHKSFQHNPLHVATVWSNKQKDASETASDSSSLMNPLAAMARQTSERTELDEEAVVKQPAAEESAAAMQSLHVGNAAPQPQFRNVALSPQPLQRNVALSPPPQRNLTLLPALTSQTPKAAWQQGASTSTRDDNGDYTLRFLGDVPDAPPLPETETAVSAAAVTAVAVPAATVAAAAPTVEGGHGGPGGLSHVHSVSSSRAKPPPKSARRR